MIWMQAFCNTCSDFHMEKNELGFCLCCNSNLTYQINEISGLVWFARQLIRISTVSRVQRTQQKRIDYKKNKIKGPDVGSFAKK